MTKQEAGKRARELRQKAGLSQTDLSDVTGVPQAVISRIERGDKVSQATAEAFVDLIAETSPDKLREMVKAATAKKVEKVAKLPEQRTALAREIMGFRKRTSMTNALVGDVLGISSGYVSQIISGYLPSKEKVADFRAAMAKYEGKKVPVEKQVSDKPHTTQPPKPSASGLREMLEATAKPPVAKQVAPSKAAPKLITPDMIEERVVQPDPEVTKKFHGSPPATSVPAAQAKIPAMTAVEARGTFLPNGTNLAPHLTIDGNTMHVFTLVPGGVFLSKLTAKENA